MATVRKGDDYLSIAKRYGLDPDRLARANKYNKLNVGQPVVFPRITAVGEDGMEFIYDTPGPGMQVIPHEQSMEMMRKGVRPARGMAIGGYLDDDPYGGIDPYNPPKVSYLPPTTTTVSSRPPGSSGSAGAGTTGGASSIYTAPTQKPQSSGSAGAATTGGASTIYTAPTQTTNTIYAENTVPTFPGVPTYNVAPPITAPLTNPSSVPTYNQPGQYYVEQQTTPGQFYYDNVLGVASQGPSTPIEPTPSGPARPGPAASETRPGTGGGQSLDATKPYIADYFFGAMAGFDPFGYQWNNGVLVSTGEKPIDARVPVALPGNFMDVVNSLPAEQAQEWLNYISALYHYDAYSDQWIVNNASEAGVLDSASGGSGGGGYGGGGGGGYGGYNGGAGGYKNYSSAIQGLVNWRGVSFA